MMKKFTFAWSVSLLLLCIMCITPAPAALAQAGSSPAAAVDRTMSGWAAADVQWMIDSGIVPESLQGDYRALITRYEYSWLVYSAMNYFVAQATGAGYALSLPRSTRFADADSPYLDTVYALGIVSGMSDTEFQPDAHITREQGAVMMANMLRTVSLPDLSDADFGFADKLSISGWAANSVNLCANAGIFAGTERGFRPHDPYTREQAIATIRRMIDATGGTVATVKLRNMFELPLHSLTGSLVVGSDYVKVARPGNADDRTLDSLLDGFALSLSPTTIDWLRTRARDSGGGGDRGNGPGDDAIQDGPYTLSVPDERHIVRISW